MTDLPAGRALDEHCASDPSIALTPGSSWTCPRCRTYSILNTRPPAWGLCDYCEIDARYMGWLQLAVWRLVAPCYALTRWRRVAK